MTARIWARGCTFAATAVLLLQPAFTQTKGTGTGSTTTGTTTTGTTGTGTGTGTTGTTGTGRTNIPSVDPNANTTQQQAPAPLPPVMVSGRVLMEDGTPAPSSVVVERVCNGIAHSEGYADSKGYFVLQLGQNNGMIADASENSEFRNFPQGSATGMGRFGSSTSAGPRTGSSLADNRFANCDLRARLAGYRSQSVSLMDHSTLSNPDVGTILLHQMASSEGTTVNVKALAVPKAAKNAFTKGQESAKKRQVEDALKNYQTAVELYPQYAEAWCELGKMQAAGGQLDVARKSFQAAIAADAQTPAPYLELSLLDLHDKRWTELAEDTIHVLKLNSFDYPQAYFLNGVANYNLKQWDVAEKSARAAKRLDTRHMFPQNSYLLGEILVNRQQYTEAADELRNYLVASPQSSDATMVRQQLDSIEKMAITSSAVAKKDQQ